MEGILVSEEGRTTSLNSRKRFCIRVGLGFKACSATAVGALLVLAAPQLGPVATLIFLDLLLAIYLASLFRGKYRYLFLVHPVFLLVSSFGFEIPYTEIGVAYSYIGTFERFVDPSNMAIDVGSIADNILGGNGNAAFGFGVVYVGTIPILLLPNLLFQDPPEIAVYLSLGFFTMLYAAIAVSVALYFGVMKKDIILIIALFSTISPTFFEINSSLHRYGLLVFGLILFFVSYSALYGERRSQKSIRLYAVMLSAIFVIGVSKIALFLSIILFVLLDLLSKNKFPLLSAMLCKLEGRSRLILLVLGVGIAPFLAQFVAPEKYVMGDSQSGGQYPGLINAPILGLVLRLVYAALSPFPWVGFSQDELYGFNELFLFVHILSALVAVWLIMSFFFRIGPILNGRDDIRMSAIFGVAVMSSLAFSSIGFHVYLAPALPFLAAIVLDKRNHIHGKYPFGFCVVMEIVAHAARMV